MADKEDLVERIVSEPVERNGYITYEVERRENIGGYEFWRMLVFQDRVTGQIHNRAYIRPVRPEEG